jgi:FixJ family two-component response regulator
MLTSRVATSDTPIVLVVDDDDSIRRAFARLLAAAGYAVETFPSAAALLEREPVERPACLVLDIRMSGLSGLDLQDLLRSTGKERATVFVSAHGDVPSSVRAMKGGAVDFLTKPVDEVRLLAAVQQALERDRLTREDREQLGELRQRFETLTRREREVCALVATGRLNKQVAAILGTSEITVKAHRAHVMAKMQVKSFADLVRMADRLGLKDPAAVLGGQ